MVIFTIFAPFWALLMAINSPPNPYRCQTFIKSSRIHISIAEGSQVIAAMHLMWLQICGNSITFRFYFLAWGMACSHGYGLKSALPHSFFFFIF